MVWTAEGLRNRSNLILVGHQDFRLTCKIVSSPARASMHACIMHHSSCMHATKERSVNRGNGVLWRRSEPRLPRASLPERQAAQPAPWATRQPRRQPEMTRFGSTVAVRRAARTPACSIRQIGQHISGETAGSWGGWSAHHGRTDQLRRWVIQCAQSCHQTNASVASLAAEGVEAERPRPPPPMEGGRCSDSSSNWFCHHLAKQTQTRLG